MPLPASLPAAILETILTDLAALFLAGAKGDTAAARDAASQMLASYRAETQDEARLAAGIIGFSFRALAALGQAAAPDIAPTRALRLTGSAVSLSREAAKFERRLGLLQKARQQPVAAQTASHDARIEQPAGTEPAPAIGHPAIEQPDAIQDTLVKPLGKVAALAKANGTSWTRAYEDRQREIRIAASIKRAEARFGAPANPPVEPQTAQTV